MPYYARMNAFNRRDFVMGSTALGLVLATRAGARPGRILPHRLDEPEGRRVSRCGAELRRLPLPDRLTGVGE
jgi:hypothetical protein